MKHAFLSLAVLAASTTGAAAHGDHAMEMTLPHIAQHAAPGAITVVGLFLAGMLVAGGALKVLKARAAR